MSKLNETTQPNRREFLNSTGLATLALSIPIGMQLIGNHFDEARLLNAAHAYEN